MSKPFKGQIHLWKRRKGYQGTEHIVGVPTEHPEFSDWIITSPVVKITPMTTAQPGPYFHCETKNSVYYLVGPEQEEEVPCPLKNYEKYGISF